MLSLVAGLALGAAVPTEKPDSTSVACSDISISGPSGTCDGVTYDLSGLHGPDNAWFSAPGEDGVYEFYVQLSGLPTTNGPLSYCNWAPGENEGNAVGQGTISNDICYPIGLQAGQTWELVQPPEGSDEPQRIDITLTGRFRQRTVKVQIACDPSAGPAGTGFTFVGEQPELTYTFQLSSSLACTPGDDASYRCLNDMCQKVPLGHGVSKSECEAACGPDNQKYECAKSVCVPTDNPRGLPLQECEDFCKGDGAIAWRER